MKRNSHLNLNEVTRRMFDVFSIENSLELTNLRISASLFDLAQILRLSKILVQKILTKIITI